MAGAIIIGQTASYNTWCRLRAVFAPLASGENYSREYSTAFGPYVAFKSASPGSGLIKADSEILQDQSNFNFFLVAVNEQDNPSPPPDKMYDYGIQLSWRMADGAGSLCLVPLEVQNILLGKTVTTANSFTFDITSDLFAEPDGIQIFAPEETEDPGDVVSVETLTPIT